MTSAYPGLQALVAASLGAAVALLPSAFAAPTRTYDAPDRATSAPIPEPEQTALKRASNQSKGKNPRNGHALNIRFQLPAEDAEALCFNTRRRPGDRVSACTDALLRGPTNDERKADLHAQRAMAYYAAGEWEIALEDFGFALTLNPDLTSALNGRCWISAIKKQNFAQARRDCDRAIALDPAFHEAYDSRAILSLREGDWEAAWQDFDMAVRLRRDVPAFLYGRGFAALALGDAQASQADVAAAIAINPSVANEYRDMGFDLLSLRSHAPVIAPIGQ